MARANARAVSVLIAADGHIAGVRIVTDPHVADVERRRAWTMRRFIRARFGSESWDCVDKPQAEEESPVGSRYINQDCEKVSEDGLHVAMKTRLRRKAG